MGVSNPSELLVGHGQAESSVADSCIFFDAIAARMPKARCVGLAASMLALSVPDTDVNASRVVAGERSDSISSMRRGRVGDLDGVPTWPFGRKRGVEGSKRLGLSMDVRGGASRPRQDSR